MSDFLRSVIDYRITNIYTLIIETSINLCFQYADDAVTVYYMIVVVLLSCEHIWYALKWFVHMYVTHKKCMTKVLKGKISKALNSISVGDLYKE